MLDPGDEMCYASCQVMVTRVFSLHHEQHASRAARGWSQFAIGDEREREFLPECGSGGAARRGSGDGRWNAAV